MLSVIKEEYVGHVFKKFLYDSLPPFERALKMELYYVENVEEIEGIIMVDLISLYEGDHETVTLDYFTGRVSDNDGYPNFNGFQRFEEYVDLDDEEDDIFESGEIRECIED